MSHELTNTKYGSREIRLSQSNLRSAKNGVKTSLNILNPHFNFLFHRDIYRKQTCLGEENDENSEKLQINTVISQECHIRSN